MKPSICIDIDNCLAVTDVVIRSIILDLTDGEVDLEYEDVREFDYFGDSCRTRNGKQISRDIWHAVHDSFSKAEVIRTLRPMNGAVDAIRELSEHFQIHLATTRLARVRIATVEWLESLDIEPQTYALHFVQHRRKHEALANVTIAVDDDPAQADLFATSGVRAIVFAHPWNACSSLERLPSWSMIQEALILT